MQWTFQELSDHANATRDLISQVVGYMRTFMYKVLPQGILSVFPRLNQILKKISLSKTHECDPCFLHLQNNSESSLFMMFYCMEEKARF